MLGVVVIVSFRPFLLADNSWICAREVASKSVLSVISPRWDLHWIVPRMAKISIIPGFGRGELEPMTTSTFWLQNWGRLV